MTIYVKKVVKAAEPLKNLAANVSINTEGLSSALRILQNAIEEAKKDLQLF